MFETLKEVYQKGDTICLHGGEVCTLPIFDLEKILKKIRTFLDEKGETHQSISLQSSLFKMSNEHIRLFKKYKVGIGISVDGPPELNILRGPRDEKRNKEYQKKLVQNIKSLKKNNINPGYIAVLTKANASKEKIDILIKWAIENRFDGRFNPMFVPVWNKELEPYKLTPEELKYAWLKLAEVCIKDKTLMWNPFREFVDNLLGSFHLSSCSVTRCDYLTTTCKTIMGNGTLSRCDRCFQEGYHQRGAEQNFVRSEMLKITECDGCRYFEICGGGCPGEAIDGDPRHKTYFCEAYYALYEYLESYLRGLMPNIVLSIDEPDYYEKFDRKNLKLDFFRNFVNGVWRIPPPQQPPQQQGQQQNGNLCRPHGDHYDANHINNIRPHGDHYDNK